jgi:ABC-type amino acid transport substrate-binding protein
LALAGLIGLALAVLLLGGAVSPGPAAASPPPAAPPGPSTPLPAKVVVGVTEVAPFAMHGPDGGWRGIVVDLWREIARELNLDYTLVELAPEALAHGLLSGSLDVAAATMSPTPEAEAILDFSHAYFHTGLGIAVPYHGDDGWLTHFRRIFNSRPVIFLFFMFLVVVMAGMVIWLMERKRNPEHFGGSPLKGFFSGLWWSAQTLATVGYGDTTVRTTAGKVLGLFWMLASLVLTAIFGAVVTSSLTLASLEGKVRGAQDLDSVRVGTVAMSTGDAYLTHRRFNFARYPDLHQGLDALLAGKLDAFVFDQPTLRYLAAKDYHGDLAVLPDFLRGENYALTFPDKSPLREPVNMALLKVMRSERWRSILYEYLGQGAES